MKKVKRQKNKKKTMNGESQKTEKQKKTSFFLFIMNGESQKTEKQKKTIYFSGL